MDLDVFLQVIGCGIYNPELDDLLLTGVEGGRVEEESMGYQSS